MKAKVLRVAIAPREAIVRYTRDIVAGRRRRAADDPDVWFTSVESFAKVLSERNRALLALIAERRPDSIDALAVASGRAKSNPHVARSSAAEKGDRRKPADSDVSTLELSLKVAACVLEMALGGDAATGGRPGAIAARSYTSADPTRARRSAIMEGRSASAIASFSVSIPCPSPAASERGAARLTRLSLCPARVRRPRETRSKPISGLKPYSCERSLCDALLLTQRPVRGSLLAFIV